MMFSWVQLHTVLFGILALTVAHANGQPASPGPSLPQDKLPLRTDWNGDPLPMGALARIGAVRLRHAGQISKLLFTLDGKGLISAGGEPVIRLWDLTTGRELRRFEGHAGAVCSVALSPDGKILASGGDDSTICLWDVASGCELRRWTSAENANPIVAFAPDGKVLGSTGKENSLNFWDVDKGREIRQFKPLGRDRSGWARRDESTISKLCFSSDGRHVLSATDDALTLWDLTTAKRLRKYDFSNRANWNWGNGDVRVSGSDIIAWMTLSSDGQTIAVTSSSEGSISLFELSSIEERARLDGDGGPVVAVVFAADGKTLVSAAADGNLRFWDTAAGRVTKKIAIGKELIREIAIAPNQRTAAVCSQGSRIRLWDLTTGKERDFGGQPEPFSAIGFTAAGRNVVAVDSCSIQEREIATGKVVCNVRWADAKASSNVLLSADRRWLVHSRPGQPLRLLDAATGKELRSLAGKHDQWYLVTVSPDGKTVAAVTVDENSAAITRLWDTSAGLELPQLPAGPMPLQSLTFSPDGRTLVTSETDGSIRFVELATGQERRRLRPRLGFGMSSESVTEARMRMIFIMRQRQQEQETQGASPLVFAPDGKTLANNEGEVIRLVDLATGKIVHRLASDVAISGEVVFSPDGKLIAAGALDYAVWVWHVPTGEFLGRLDGHRGSVQRLAFAPDSKTLVSASDDGTALIWDVPTALQAGRLRPGAESHAARPESLWVDLADADATRAYSAIRKLAQTPETTVCFLRDRLRPAPAVDAQRIAKLVADLDNPEFPTREKANAQLEQLHELAAPALRKALSAPASAEARRRVEAMLEKLRRRQVPPENLRALRCLELLELIGSPAAIELVRTLSRGAPEAKLTQEAKAAHERLSKWLTGGP
jgi:WD40 repeat protein